MAKYRRKGRKASKRTVRCTLCTTYRWMGNTKERFRFSDRRRKEQFKVSRNSLVSL